MVDDAIFLPYQSAWVADESPVRVAEKSRRIGWSWAQSGASVIEAGRRTRPLDQWYMGYNEEMALEFILDAADWTRALGVAASAHESLLIEDEDKDILSYQIRLSTGKRITALSSKPTNFRNKSGHAIIDEAGFVDNLDELLKAAMAFLVWGGRVSIISTHNGYSNPFNVLCRKLEDGRIGYSHHRVTFDEAVDQGLYRKICEAKGDAWTLEDEKAWKDDIYSFYGEDADEELRCVPRRMGGTYIENGWLEPHRCADAPEDCRVYMASDFAVTQKKKGNSPDWTEVGVFAVAPDGGLYVLDWWSGQVTSDVYIEEIMRLYKKYKPMCFFGEGGVIRQAVEPFMRKEMRRQRAYMRVEWLNPGRRDKAARGRPLQGMCHSGMVHFPYTKWADAVISQIVSFVPGEDKQVDDKFDTMALMCSALDEAHPGLATKTDEKDDPDMSYSRKRTKRKNKSWRTI